MTLAVRARFHPSVERRAISARARTCEFVHGVRSSWALRTWSHRTSRVKGQPSTMPSCGAGVKGMRTVHSDGAGTPARRTAAGDGTHHRNRAHKVVAYRPRDFGDRDASTQRDSTAQLSLDRHPHRGSDAEQLKGAGSDGFESGSSMRDRSVRRWATCRGRYASQSASAGTSP